MKEGKCIQDHLQSTIHSGLKFTSAARKFKQLMKLGKVTAALKLLSTDAKGILPLNSKILCSQDGEVDAVWKLVRDILAKNILQVGLQSLIPFLNLIVLMLLVIIPSFMNSLLVI